MRSTRVPFGSSLLYCFIAVGYLVIVGVALVLVEMAHQQAFRTMYGPSHTHQSEHGLDGSGRSRGCAACGGLAGSRLACGRLACGRLAAWWRRSGLEQFVHYALFDDADEGAGGAADAEMRLAAAELSQQARRLEGIMSMQLRRGENARRQTAPPPSRRMALLRTTSDPSLVAASRRPAARGASGASSPPTSRFLRAMRPPPSWRARGGEHEMSVLLPAQLDAVAEVSPLQGQHDTTAAVGEEAAGADEEAEGGMILPSRIESEPARLRPPTR